jgi:hypothetical protein
MWICLLCIGGMAFIGNKASNLAIGSLLIALNFLYNSTLGPVCYVIISETSSTRLRQKSVALSRMAYQVMNIICHTINPKMLSPLACKSCFCEMGHLRSKGTGGRKARSSGRGPVVSPFCTASFDCPRPRTGRTASWIFCSSTRSPRGDSSPPKLVVSISLAVLGGWI